MAAARPFVSAGALLTIADVVWAALGESDWLEAFAAHPRIGAGDAGGSGGLDRTDTLAERWSTAEQSQVATAAAPVLVRLAEKNREYEARFGYIFIVCAAGRSAAEMLAMLEQRVTNDAATEIRAAAEEQRKITRLRLQRLIGIQATR